MPASNQPSLFSAPLAKIARARVHIAELECAIAAYIASKPVTVASNVTKNGVTINMTFDQPPETIGVIVGDVIHNLRAALDLTACDLVRLQNGNLKGVHFPFCEKDSELNEMIHRKHFDRAGPEAVALLRSLRPYRNGNSALRAIHDLDIQDKHQALIPTPMNFNSPVFRMHDANGNPDFAFVGDPNAATDLRVIFPDDSALAGQDLIPTLHRLVETAEGVIESFRTLPRVS